MHCETDTARQTTWKTRRAVVAKPKQTTKCHPKNQSRDVGLSIFILFLLTLLLRVWDDPWLALVHFPRATKEHNRTGALQTADGRVADSVLRKY